MGKRQKNLRMTERWATLVEEIASATTLSQGEVLELAIDRFAEALRSEGYLPDTYTTSVVADIAEKKAG